MPKLTREQVRKREQAQMDYWRAQQRRVQRAIFTSSEAGGRGAVSPLGGTAVPAKQPARKR